MDTTTNTTNGTASRIPGKTVDAGGAARATRDEQAARAAGFSPQPPVYTVGTLVGAGAERRHPARDRRHRVATGTAGEGGRRDGGVERGREAGWRRFGRAG